MIQDRQVLFQRLAEPNTRIDDDQIATDSLRFGNADRLFEVRFDFAEDVQAWVDSLHGGWFASHMHKHKRCMLTGHHRRKGWIKPQSTNVVDDAGSIRNRRRSNLTLVGVDRNRNSKLTR